MAKKKPAESNEERIANKKYLEREIKYDGDRLLDEEARGVMMQWEAPLMAAHAEVICRGSGTFPSPLYVAFLTNFDLKTLQPTTVFVFRKSRALLCVS